MILGFVYFSYCQIETSWEFCHSRSFISNKFIFVQTTAIYTIGYGTRNRRIVEEMVRMLISGLWLIKLCILGVQKVLWNMSYLCFESNRTEEYHEDVFDKYFEQILEFIRFRCCYG